MFPPNTNVFVRTVTFHYTGRITNETTDAILALADAAWIADSGRFSTALNKGKLSEVEPYPDGVIFLPIGAIVDISEWKHELPRTQI